MLAPAPSASPRASAASRRRLLTAAGLAVVVLLAYAVRLRLLTHGSGIAASDGYDDGVYYAAADAFVHGRLPYKAFLFLHPPGIIVALAPFAALGAVFGDPVGVTVARLVFVGIGAANAGLVAAIALRHSRRAALIAGIAYAVFFPVAYAERSTLLEPLGSLLLLVGVVLARRGGARASVVAGLVAGLSMDVKIWYIVPVAVLVLAQRGHRLRFAGGAVASAAALGLPFLLQNPVAMVREVVLDQIGRPRIARSLTHRLVLIMGDPFAGYHGETREAQRIAITLLVVLLIAAAVAWRVRWARTFVVLSAATGAVLIAGPSFYSHYTAFVAPWMLIVLGIGAAEAIGMVRLRWLRIAFVGLLLVAFTAANVPSIHRFHDKAQPVAALTRVLARTTGCVVSDDPGLLADANVLSRDLAAGCTVWPDVTGWTYEPKYDVRRDGVAVARQDDVPWQHAVMAYLQSGSVVVLNRAATGLDAASQREIAALPVIAHAGRLVVHAVR